MVLVLSMVKMVVVNKSWIVQILTLNIHMLVNRISSFSSNTWGQINILRTSIFRAYLNVLNKWIEIIWLCFFAMKIYFKVVFDLSCSCTEKLQDIQTCWISIIGMSILCFVRNSGMEKKLGTRNVMNYSINHNSKINGLFICLAVANQSSASTTR